MKHQTNVDPTLQRLLDEVIKPHAVAIASVWDEFGDAAVVFFEPAPGIRQEAMRVYQWDGRTPVVRMPPDVAERIAAACKQRGDLVTSRWLTGKRIGRIFVVAHNGGTLLINHEVGKGFSLEPDSSDAAWLS